MILFCYLCSNKRSTAGAVERVKKWSFNHWGVKLKYEELGKKVHNIKCSASLI